MKYAVLLDFGSTYTKVVCVDLEQKCTVLTDKFPSTVHTDASIALGRCFDAVEKVIGKENLEAACKYSTSSAAGGLRIAVSGLTRSLSNAAGRNACFSAGGKLVHTAVGKLTDEDISQIEKSGAEILLLCGGYEKGNSEGVLANGEKVARSNLRIPVIYAGNSKVSPQIRALMGAGGKECFLAENIIPEVGKLNLKSVTDIIRNLFMTRITNMKGVGFVQGYLNGPIIPTPASVLKAGELLSRGTEESPGIGDFMMVDVGGATTDVYSFVNNVPYDGAKMIGLVEPFAKRTVEGDLGMRESAGTLAAEMGLEKFAEESSVSIEEAKAAITMRNEDRAYIADNEKEKKIDECIARNAIYISARRHAGYVERGFLNGVQLLQYGKNLCDIKKVIGTGGIIVNAKDPHSRLAQVNLKEKEEGRVLLPATTESYVDKDYVFYAAGLLSEDYPDVAIEIMKKSIGLK